MTDDVAVRIRAVLQAGCAERGAACELVLEPGAEPGEYRVWTQPGDRMSSATQLLPIAGALTRRGYRVAGLRVGDRAWLRVRLPQQPEGARGCRTPVAGKRFPRSPGVAEPATVVTPGRGPTTDRAPVTCGAA